MGTGWRRAFCTSIASDRDGGEKKHLDLHNPKGAMAAAENPSSSPSPRSCAKLGFFSNPSTPRLRCRTTTTSTATAEDKDTPRLQCKTTTIATTPAATKSPRLGLFSNPSSPRSPSRFALLRSLRLSKSGSCGICMASVKTGQGMAIFTAECGHAFHFPCIAAHVRKQGCLSCPVCAAPWRHAPLLALHQQPPADKPVALAKEEEEEDTRTEPNTKMALTPVQIPKASPKPGPDSRVYDDDEPLLSPRFNPIPEADEDDEEGGDDGGDDVGEFQGFFANPTQMPNAGATAKVVEAQLLPEAAVVSVGRAHENYAVVLKIKAPPAPPPARGSGRAPVDLVTVLDVGRAMDDEKMQMLKRAVRLVVASLGPADRLCLVLAFPGNTRRLLPLRRMTPQGQRVARRLIDRLVSAPGAASVSDALRKAAKVLEDRRERNPVATIMLLSDGQDDKVPPANHRSRPQVPSPSATTRFAHVEIPVHSIGFGSRLGLDGSGSGHDVFAKCIGGMLSVVVQELQVHLSFPSGEIPAIYSWAGRPTLLGGSGWIRLGDLYAEEERELLLELRVPSAAASLHHAMSVKFAYRDPATQELVQSKEQALLVPRPHAVRSSDPKIERLRGAFVAVRAVAEARRLAERDDLNGAHHMLSSARALILQSGSGACAESLRFLDPEMGELHARRKLAHHHQHTPRRRGEHQVVAAMVDDNGESLTPTSAWRAAEHLAKVAIMRKSMNRVSDLHGFENARF